jgi:hypothetical protein
MDLARFQNHVKGLELPLYAKRARLADVLSHRGLLVRYILLPLSLIAVLWTLLHSYARTSGNLSGDNIVYTAAPPAYPAHRPASWPAAADEVRDAFVHAYAAYERFAAPHDELRPVARAHVDKCVHGSCARRLNSWFHGAASTAGA